MKYYSGLIDEIVRKVSTESAKEHGGILTYSKVLKHNVKLEKYNIDSKYLAKKYSKEMGLYTIVSINNILFASKLIRNYYLKVIENELKSYLKIKKEDSVLVVGLGNEDIGADSLGGKVCKNIVITRGVSNIKPMVSAIAPKVLGLTGVESADIVYGVIDKIKPNKLIVVDSLCASASNRLATSIQITNTSIIPGGGVGNSRKKISTNSSVKEMVVIGVPLIIYASTYYFENIDKNSIASSILKTLNLDKDSSDYVKICDAINKSIFTQKPKDVVTLKDIDLQVEELSHLLARAINKVLHGITDYGEI